MPDGLVAAAAGLTGAVLTKVEGTVFAVLVVGAFALFGPGRRRLRSAIRMALPPFLALAGWLAYCRAHGLLDVYLPKERSVVTTAHLPAILKSVLEEAGYGALFAPWAVVLVLLLWRRTWRGTAVPLLCAAGFTAFKCGPEFRRNPRHIETPAQVQYCIERFAALRKAAGNEVDIGIDFHGKISPALAKVLIRGLEPHQPMFVEEPINCQTHDIMAEIARGTHLPIATGERVFTKWGFREILEKGAAQILQPDVNYAGGITELRLIAGMAEAYYFPIAPHNPNGPCSLAASAWASCLTRCCSGATAPRGCRAPALPIAWSGSRPARLTT